MNRRYGLLGLLSLIGILGLSVHEPSLYPFLPFALFFEYFFIEPDEMFIENMRKAAAWAFYANLGTAVLITCWCVTAKQRPDVAVSKGIGVGFGAALIVFSFMSAWFDWKDRRGISND